MNVRTHIRHIGLVLIFTSPLSLAQASEDVKANKIRETFAMSSDSKLQLAAEALGDDQLVSMIKDMKESSVSDPNVRKLIKRMR